MIVMESGLKQRVCINVKFHLRRLATIILVKWIPKKLRKFKTVPCQCDQYLFNYLTLRLAWHSLPTCRAQYHSRFFNPQDRWLWEVKMTKRYEMRKDDLVFTWPGRRQGICCGKAWGLPMIIFASFAVVRVDLFHLNSRKLAYFPYFARLICAK